MKLVFCFLLVSFLGKAHTGFTVEKQYGNVTVNFYADFYFEEINNGLIMAQYVDKLLQKKNLSKKIRLNLVHGECYVGDFYGECHSIRTIDKKNDTIVFSSYKRNFNILEVLREIDYYTEKDGEIEIDEDEIRRILQNPVSENVKSVLQEKIYRPEDTKSLNFGLSSFSYYYQNDKYHFFKKGNETPLLSLDKIFQFKPLYEGFVVFDTVSSMYFVESLQDDKNIYHHIIHDTSKMYGDYEDTYELPYIITQTSYNKVQIKFKPSHRGGGNWDNRLMIYYPEENILIQDLDKLILKKKL